MGCGGYQYIHLKSNTLRAISPLPRVEGIIDLFQGIDTGHQLVQLELARLISHSEPTPIFFNPLRKSNMLAFGTTNSRLVRNLFITLSTDVFIVGKSKIYRRQYQLKIGM